MGSLLAEEGQSQLSCQQDFLIAGWEGAVRGEGESQVGSPGGSHSRDSGEGGTVVANGGSIKIRWWPGRKVGGQNPWYV